MRHWINFPSLEMPASRLIKRLRRPETGKMPKHYDSTCSSLLNGTGNADRVNRYLSQVRQELAMRLLVRVYAGGPTPSKVTK